MLTDEQRKVLEVLDGVAPDSWQIGEKVAPHPILYREQWAARRLKVLCAAGLVEATRLKPAWRGVVYTITPAGRKMLEEEPHAD